MPPEKWRKAGDNVRRDEDDYWRSDGLIEDIIEVLVIDLGEENESDFADGDDSAVNSDLEN